MRLDVKLAMVVACSAVLAACAQKEEQASGNTVPPATQTAGVAGPYDGTWIVDAPAAGAGTTTVGRQQCEAVRLRFDVKNSQIVGNLARSPYGSNRVSEAGPGATPISGSVQPDGTFTSKWQDYTATGKLNTDNTGEMHWTGVCGPRTATGGRETNAAAGTSRPPLSQAFGILFATNSAKLDGQSRDVVRQAASAAKDNAPAHVTVGGHTDTVGSKSFNQKLSERRADAVRKELIADGVAPGDISAEGFGETDLKVPTADHVDEPRNRRVTIQVGQPGA
jgi:outer membrane protein OmpA-like peptidoglycan-associated protein